MWSMSRERWKYSANRVKKIKARLQKVIKIIMKNSKTSMKNIIKSLEMKKSFMTKFKIMFFIIVTEEKRSIQENDSFVEYFLNFWG